MSDGGEINDSGPQGIEVFLLHPLELTSADWIEIKTRALKWAERGQNDPTICAVLGYVEFLELKYECETH